MDITEGACEMGRPAVVATRRLPSDAFLLAWIVLLLVSGSDIWPLAFGHAISLQLAAHRLATQPTYLEQARRFARMAAEVFGQDNPLPRTSLKTGHYEAITGADSLALALLDLHATANGIKTPVPSNTIDR